MITPFETPARQVRTGHVIKVAVDGYRKSLHVAVVHHGSHTEPATGERLPGVWFSGWTGGEWVDRGWGQNPETLVMVVEDHQGADTYLDVSAGITTEVIG